MVNKFKLNQYTISQEKAAIKLRIFTYQVLTQADALAIMVSQSELRIFGQLSQLAMQKNDRDVN